MADLDPAPVLGSDTNPRLLRVQEVATMLGVPEGTIRWWVHTGRLTHVRFGPRSPRFKIKDVQDFVEESTRERSRKPTQSPGR